MIQRRFGPVDVDTKGDYVALDSNGLHDDR